MPKIRYEDGLENFEIEILQSLEKDGLFIRVVFDSQEESIPFKDIFSGEISREKPQVTPQPE